MLFIILLAILNGHKTMGVMSTVLKSDIWEMWHESALYSLHLFSLWPLKHQLLILPGLMIFSQEIFPPCCKTKPLC